MLGLSPTGAAQPTEEELAAFFFHQQEMYPRRYSRTPTARSFAPLRGFWLWSIVRTAKSG